MPPLTGRFEADFSNFSTAVDGATVKLRSFESDSNKVGAALSRMTDQFSGRQVIQQATLMVEAVERLGGTSKLTEAELARLGSATNEAVSKMQALGMDVPANMAKIAKETEGAGAAMSGLGTIAKSLAGPLVAMFSVQAVINFGREVLAAGDAIQKMADQTSMTTDEVQQLQYIAGQSGSSIDTLIGAAQTLQQRLGDNNAGVSGALRRMNINLEEFKKLDAYQQMTQLSTGLRGIQDPLERAATGFDLFGKKWMEIGPAMKSDMAAIGAAAPKMSREAVAGLDAIGDAFAGAKQYAISFAGEVAFNISKTILKAKELAEALKPSHFGQTDAQAADPLGLKAAMTAIPPLQLAVVEGFKGITLSAEEAAKLEKQYGDAAVESMERSIAAKKDADKVARELASAEQAYWGGVAALVERISGNEAIKSAKVWADAVDGLGDSVEAFSNDDLAEMQNAMNAAIGAMARNGTATSALADRFTQLMLRAQGATTAIKDLGQTATAQSGTITDFTLKLYQEALAADAARDARAGLAAGATGGLPPLPQEALPPGGFAGYLPPTGSYTPRAGGGPVQVGRTYVVGERGPELFTPGTSGGITPNGAGAVLVQNTFHIVDTEANIARRVSEAIMRSITQARRI